MNTDDLQLLNEKYTKDFNRALNIYENSYSHDELVELLKNGSVVEKQTAVISLNSIQNTDEAEILMSNLTNCDGKIREAVSFKLTGFVKSNPEFYTRFVDVFLDAIIDINGNICRNTILALNYMKSQSGFVTEFMTGLLNRTKLLAQKAKDFDIQDGKYKINKEIFKLYWYLETISVFSEFANKDVLHEILEDTSIVKDYTIREKTAKIIHTLNNETFNDIREKLANDDNYYVKKALT